MFCKVLCLKQRKALFPRGLRFLSTTSSLMIESSSKWLHVGMQYASHKSPVSLSVLYSPEIIDLLLTRLLSFTFNNNPAISRSFRTLDSRTITLRIPYERTIVGKQIIQVFKMSTGGFYKIIMVSIEQNKGNVL